MASQNLKQKQDLAPSLDSIECHMIRRVTLFGVSVHCSTPRMARRISLTPVFDGIPHDIPHHLIDYTFLHIFTFMADRVTRALFGTIFMGGIGMWVAVHLYTLRRHSHLRRVTVTLSSNNTIRL
jgi:hypothetical protein